MIDWTKSLMCVPSEDLLDALTRATPSTFSHSRAKAVLAQRGWYRKYSRITQTEYWSNAKLELNYYPWNRMYLSWEEAHEQAERAIGKDENMASKAVLERQHKATMARLIELESQIDELSAMEQQFGKDEDFPDGSCIMFNRSFGRGGLYSYAALKCAKNSWFITGKYQAPMTYEMLVENHLRHALEEDQLLVVVKKVQDLTTLVKK